MKSILLGMLSLSACLLQAQTPGPSDVPGLSGVRNGILCLTFDDAGFVGWTNAIPLFAKYDAHATFFAYGKLSTNYLHALKTLQSAGHTIGLHTVGHCDAPAFFTNCCASTYFNEQLRPQFEACEPFGLRPRHLAYPNNRCSDETDAYLAGSFVRFRAGAPLGRQRGYYAAGHTNSIVGLDGAFFPVSELPRHRRMGGVGVGEYYHTDIDDICRGIRRAAARNEVFVIFSHDIAPDAKNVSMKTAWLERILATAKESGVSMRGFDELGPVEPQRPTEPLELVISFDDGQKNHLTLAAAELERRGWRGIFCIVTDWVGQKENKLSWDDVRELQRRGHVIATHTRTHVGLGNLCRQGNQARVRQEMRESCDIFTRETGVRPKLLCLPGTNCHPDVIKIAREEGLVVMTVPRVCFGSWGNRAKDEIAALRGRGATRRDFLVHGVCPEGGGWRPFPSVAKFIEFLDDIKQAEQAGEVRVVSSDWSLLRQ